MTLMFPCRADGENVGGGRGGVGGHADVYDADIRRFAPPPTAVDGAAGWGLFSAALSRRWRLYRV